MFSNRGYGWKLAGAVALVLGLGALSGVAGSDEKPPLFACLAQPERWDGRKLWISSADVISVAPGTFVIEAGGLSLRVDGPAAVERGDRVGVSGTFEAAGPSLRLRAWRKLENSAWKRRVMEAVSILVLAAILVNFLRHFAVRPEAVRVEGRD